MKTTVVIAVAALASAMTFALPVEPEGRLFASWTAGSTESGGTSLSSAGPSTAGAAGLGLGDILSGVGAASAGGEQGGQVIAGGQSGLGFGKLLCVPDSA